MCLITLELKDGENGGKLAQRCKIREETICENYKCNHKPHSKSFEQRVYTKNISLHVLYVS